ncbi:MAG: hypothetical protein AB8B95_07275 [Pseudohongiellaceae bacterium]
MKTMQSILLAVTLLASTMAMAANFKTINQSINAENFSALQVEFSVGELEIDVWDGDTVELEIELRAERSWLTWRRKDVEDVELDIQEKGGALMLSIDEGKLNQSWVLKVPARLALEIDLGVGEISIDGLNNNLVGELGVGEFSIKTSSEDFDMIQASVGVGDASLRGFGSGSENERSLVSADAIYVGSGEYEVEVEVGVGEVSIRRN